MKFKRKLEIIDAVQWDGTWEDVPKIKKFTNGQVRENSDLDFKRSYIFLTIPDAGMIMVSPSNWIIKDARGRFTVITSDMFEVRYDKMLTHGRE